MIQALDHVSIDQGREYIYEILAMTEWDTKFTEVIKRLDEYGQPIKFNFKPYGKFSPTLLRYLKVNIDLVKYFAHLKDIMSQKLGGLEVKQV